MIYSSEPDPDIFRYTGKGMPNAVPEKKDNMDFTEMLKDPRLPSLQQDYRAYTPEDHQVWKLLFERQHRHLPKYASEAFLEGLRIIGFSSARIADFDDVNRRLSSITGWSVHVVPGLIDDDLFFGLLKNKRFPSSTWLRKLSELDYLQEPDMFHDAFAHLPMLTIKPYVDFLEQLADIALDHIDNPLAIEMLSRVYWYTIEFGLIRENEQLKVYGAGILSSTGETRFALSKEPKHLNFNVQSMINTPYWKNKFQDRYFVIDSFEQLFGAIPEIRKQLEEELAKSMHD